MVVAFAITEINYVVVSLFFDMVLILSYVYWPAINICGIKLFWPCYLPSIATKAAMAFLNHSLCFRRRSSGRVIFKQNAQKYLR